MQSGIGASSSATTRPTGDGSSSLSQVPVRAGSGDHEGVQLGNARNPTTGVGSTASSRKRGSSRDLPRESGRTRTAIPSGMNIARSDAVVRRVMQKLI
ncbi:MAG: hypothetical protein AAFV29_09400, partial [Myxococcota bacterium]